MKLLLIASLLCLPLTAAAEESEKVYRARMENDLEKDVERVNEKCGSKLTVTIDWGTFAANKDGWSRRSVSGYCEAPLNALRYFCDGGAKAKAYIQKNVETITCHAAKDQKGWKILFNKGHVHWHVSPDSKNNDQYAKSQLLKTL